MSTLCQVNLQNQSLCKHKTYIHIHQTQIFEDEEGGFYKYNEFTTHNYIKMNFLEYFGCIQAIKTYFSSHKITIDANQTAISKDLDPGLRN